MKFNSSNIPRILFLHLYKEAEIAKDRVRVGMGYIMLPAMLHIGKNIYKACALFIL
jgi:hypothetical protein